MKRLLAGIVAILMFCGGVPAFAAAPQTPWWQEAFLLDAAKVDTSYLTRATDHIGISADAALTADLGKMSPTEQEDIGKAVLNPNLLIVTMQSGNKYTYSFYEKGIKLEKSPMDEKAATRMVSLSLDKKTYTAFLKSLVTSFEGKPWGTYSSWLTVMRMSRAESIKLTAKDKSSSMLYKNDDENFERVFCGLRSVSVDPSTMRKVKTGSSLRDATKAEIPFQNGVTYTIWFSDTSLLVNASDMKEALLYQITDSYNEIDRWARSQPSINPATGKPVIYLYPQEKQDVSVQVHFKGALATTDPAYNGGWNVTAYPDGTIVNKADGKTYPYLFWDGYSNEDWDFSEGFVVKGTEAEAFLTEKLEILGLIPAEAEEFIDYWLPELQQNAYNLITFSTEQYEALAPLTISPAPDRVLRVHMVFKGIDAPVTIQPQKLTRFVRGGFTVVEWGGTRA